MSETRSPLDELIDDAARSMTTAPAPALLREKVRARIEDVGIRRRGRAAWRAPIWQVSAAGVSLAMLAVWIGTRTSVVPDMPPAETTVAIVDQATNGVTAGTAQPLDSLPAAPVAPAPRTVPIPATPRQSAVIATPLREIPPVVIEPIADDGAAGDARVDLMALDIEPLRVEPLSWR